VRCWDRRRAGEKLAKDARHDQFAFVSQIAVEDGGIWALAQNFFWISGR
jgi:hypothetical protein